MHSSTHSVHSSSFVRNGVRVLAAGLSLVAAVAIWTLVAGRFDDTSGRVLLSGAAAALCTLGGLAGATALAPKGRRRVGEGTIALSQVTLLLALALIWIPGADGSEMLMRALGVTSVSMLAGAHASLLIARSRPLDTRAVRRLGQVAIFCATSVALLISGVFVLSEGPIASDFWRVVGVLLVLALLSTLLVPLARKAMRGGRARESC